MSIFSGIEDDVNQEKVTEDSHAELADIVAMVKNSLDMWAAFLTRHDLLNKEHLPSELDNATTFQVVF